MIDNLVFQIASRSLPNGASGKFCSKTRTFTVLSGSQVNMKDEIEKRQRVLIARRNELVKTGKIEEKDGKFYLLSDEEFKSASAAACFVLGGSRNGNLLWKDAEGVSFGRRCREALENAAKLAGSVYERVCNGTPAIFAFNCEMPKDFVADMVLLFGCDAGKDIIGNVRVGDENVYPGILALIPEDITREKLFTIAADYVNAVGVGYLMVFYPENGVPLFYEIDKGNDVVEGGYETYYQPGGCILVGEQNVIIDMYANEVTAGTPSKAANEVAAGKHFIDEFYGPNDVRLI